MLLNIFLIVSGSVLFLIVLALVMPARILLNAAAGKDEDIWISSRIMFFNGFTGIGFHIGKNFTKLSFLILSKKIIEAEVQSIATKLIKKIKKPKPEKIEPEKPKTILTDKLKLVLSKSELFKNNYWNFKKFFREVLIFENLSADVTLSFRDPAVSGIAGGIILAINGLLPHPWSIKPVWGFLNKGFRIDLDMRAKIVMINLWKFVFYNLPEIIKDFKAGNEPEKENISKIGSENTLINQEAD